MNLDCWLTFNHNSICHTDLVENFDEASKAEN